jgi:hypothetical protein
MWDSNGFAIWYKELEKGTFGSLEMGKNTSVELVWSDLVMLLEGIEISSIKCRKRYLKNNSWLLLLYYKKRRIPSLISNLRSTH